MVRGGDGYMMDMHAGGKSLKLEIRNWGEGQD